MNGWISISSGYADRASLAQTVKLSFGTSILVKSVFVKSWSFG